MHAARAAMRLALVAVLIVGCYPSITIGPDSLPDGAVGQPYSATLSATSSEEIFSIAVATGLPPGLAIAYTHGDATASLTGTPTTAGTYTFDVEAYGPQFNSGGAKGRRTYSVVIR